MMHLKQTILLKQVIFICLFSTNLIVSAQVTEYGNELVHGFENSEGTYTIEQIRVTGAEYLDENALKSIAGIKKGDRIEIPGPRITDALKRLWRQGLMDDIAILIDSISGDKVYLNISITELTRLSEIEFAGIKKGQMQALEDRMGLILGKIITSSLVRNSEHIIQEYFREKGFYEVSVNTRKIKDNYRNTSKLIFNIDVNKKYRISRIVINGNQKFSDQKLKKQMAGIKEKTRFKPFASSPESVFGISEKHESSKNGIKEYLHERFHFNLFGNTRLIKDKLTENQEALLLFYRNQGYRDVAITKDSLVKTDSDHMEIHYQINEGMMYYLRNIKWVGNFKYSEQELNAITGIQPGDVYSMENIRQRLTYNPIGTDVSSLYLDNGFLLFRIDPIEVSVENDLVDIEIRMQEGPEFVINQIQIKGNDITSDHVIRRELRTLPGQKFSRQDVIRSTRELAGLGFLNPESTDVEPVIDAANGTVDLIYTVQEQSGTEFQASAGLDNYSRFFGTLGISLNNFSSGKLFKPGQWRGLPIGDGQKLQITAQSNASTFKNYSLSFSEPWLGGNKNTSLHFNVSHVVNSRYNYELDKIGKVKLNTGSLALSKRLKWPDDYFQLQHRINFSEYRFSDYNNSLGISNGNAYNINWETTLSRYSLDNPTYPRNGSSISLKLSLTPPFTLLGNKEYSETEKSEKYRLIEYHKYDFDASVFTPIVGNLVFHAKASMGFIGSYSSKLGIGPFDRYILGGNGLGSNNDILIGSESIGLRGYDENSLNPVDQETGFNGGVLFNKFTFELRYPLSFSPLIYGLAFLESGNTWNDYKDYNPGHMFKSAGVGIRINLPGMGMLGIDYGHAFDSKIGNLTPVKKGITFTLGGNRR